MVGLHGTTNLATPPAIALLRNAEDVVVEGIRISGPGVGIAVVNAKVTVRRTEVRKTAVFGVVVQGTGSVATIESTLIADTQPRPNSQEQGYALHVRQGGTATILRSAVLRSRAVALFAAGLGTTISVENSVISDTLPQASDLALGIGVASIEGAAATVRDSAVVGNRSYGAHSLGKGSSLNVVRSLIANTAIQESDKRFGGGLGIAAGTTAAMTRTILADTLLDPTQLYGVGLLVSDGADVETSDCTVVRNRSTGVLATDPGTWVRTTGTLIADTFEATKPLSLGRGMDVSAGARADIVGSAILRSVEGGIHARGGNTLVSVDASLISDTMAQTTGHLLGQGVSVNRAAKGVVTGSVVRRSQHSGVSTLASNGLAIERSLILDTRPTFDETYGVGLVCALSPVTVKRTIIADSHTAGVLLVPCEGTIEESAIEGVVEGAFHRYAGPTLGQGMVIATYGGIAD
ncbi:MAG: right-handed parallel beta-helix repeat-containing protein, partial [Myxococcota bacterium]